ncbi:MAG: nucleotide exchange factor GrpE [Bacteroidales bacterium]|nr:nucleotide exchange factor GrpE [Bacteroidales bacterium]MBR4586610.1 nucleotide exchange factor GrpE [Bacteroidales bacterium]
MSEEKDIKQETQVEEPVEQTPQAEEPKKKQKKEQRKEEALRKEIAELTDNLAKEKQQVAKEKESYLRLMAEFETFRRRSAEDRLNLISSASAKTIEGLLPVLDDCERALEMLSKSSDEAAKEGTTLIYNKLMDYLKTQGLARIEAKGEVFNTDFHEAVTQFPAPSEDLKGKVIDVVQTGYTLGGKVLRYAKVVVGA